MVSKLKRNTVITLLLLLIAISNSCTKQPGDPISVYTNDFETGNLQGIENGVISLYNGTHVLGRFNHGNFELSLKDLPAHKYLYVTFDLFIHDSWDGNESWGNNYVGPDIWSMLLDSKTYIYTTFGNDLGNVPQARYPVQSYPNTYPATNLPRAGAEDVKLPGACSRQNLPNGTSLYKITQRIDHTASTFSLKCFDELKEMGTTDQMCDESWSVDNIQITVAK